MKKVILFFLAVLIWGLEVKAQSDAVLKIDDIRIVFKPGLTFPYWLNASQKVQKDTNVKAISVLEFSLDSLGVLKFIKPFSILSGEISVVPEGRVWKIEAIGMNETSNDINTVTQSLAMNKISTKPSLFNSPLIFEFAGNYTFKVPPNVFSLCVEVWGGGGNGTGDFLNENGQLISGSGGGGGGYGFQCFDVIPNAEYTVTVGNSNEMSSFGSLISASPGENAVGYPIGKPGKGGSSNAYYNVKGQDGTEPYFHAGDGWFGGKGGDGATIRGGKGGDGWPPNYFGANVIRNGQNPGGGGGRGSMGAQGMVIVHW